MIDCMKKYKMVLTDDDGNIYKSDDVEIRNADVYLFGRKEDEFAEIELVMRRLHIENAEMPPEMPTAAVARKATKIIQEEKRDKKIAEEWERLMKEICEAVKRGEEEITVKTIYTVNKERLMKMGYEVDRDSYDFVFRIRWVEYGFKV